MSSPEHHIYQRLPFGKFELLLDGPRDWLAVTLCSADADTALGACPAADVRDAVARLRDAVRDGWSGPADGDIAGEPVWWLMSLSERHVTLYASGPTLAGVHIYLQSADGTFLANVWVPREACGPWARWACDDLVDDPVGS